MIYTIIKIKVEDRILLYQTDGSVVHVLEAGTDNVDMSVFRDKYRDLLNELKSVGDMMLPVFSQSVGSFDINSELDRLVTTIDKYNEVNEPKVPLISKDLLKLIYKPKRINDE